ncbi:hypothetical protein P4H82_27975 [Bacillus cereus]|nr:hypothetical protein [Bacillus cereus]MEB9190641.1 hypothetical protein [Bacillus cereus]
MGTKTAFGVYELHYEEAPILTIVFEHQKEAEDFRDEMNEKHEGVIFHYIAPVKYKPREIW